MATNMIQKRLPANQSVFNSKEGEFNMLRKAFYSFLDDLIRENAKYTSEGYSLWASELDLSDQKILLSYLVPVEDYEDALQSDVRMRNLINEQIDKMQYLISERCSDLYHQYMEEMGKVLCQHRDNGEYYYI